ncbi:MULTISPECIES: hypothetical protein [Anaerococcus]|uniref:CvpA family protein n=1 Tax=Anaerococcus cruorum TaxID=3115617 RepID=A0ABW9MWF0_9FIRM
MDFSFILRQLQTILMSNRLALLPLIFILLNFLIFIISRTFRKTGLFVLALAFGIDYAIKSIPYDIYYNFPQVYNFVTILYIVGFIIFFLKIFKILIRMSNLGISTSKKSDSKVGNFFRYTGILPFLIMLFLNLVHLDWIVDGKIIRILTSITFIYMLVKTIYSTYKYLSAKESIILGDKMDFKEIKDYLSSDESKKSYHNSKNQGRRTRKTLEKKVDPKEATETIKIDKKDIEEKISVANIESDKKENEKIGHGEYDKESSHSLSNTDLLKLVSSDFSNNHNQTTMIITSLKSGEKISYTSSRPILKIQENNEYKIDLEFENVNEYDYGRFIDILLMYSKAKDSYKFELIVSPNQNPSSKVVFFDPSNIYDIDEKDYANVGGKIISMNFPKYKINFITGN